MHSAHCVGGFCLSVSYIGYLYNCVFILQILGTLNRAFWSWNWYKMVISGFRVVSTIVLRKIKTRHTLCMHFILFGHYTSLHICNHIYYKNFNIIFQKWGGEGRRPFGIFPENSSFLTMKMALKMIMTMAMCTQMFAHPFVLNIRDFFRKRVYV